VEEVLLFNKFFAIVDACLLVAKIQPDKVVWWCRNGDFASCSFSESRASHFRHAF